MRWLATSLLVCGCMGCSTGTGRVRGTAKVPWQLALPFQRAFDTSPRVREKAPVRVVAGTAQVVGSEAVIEVVQTSETAEIGFDIDRDDRRPIVVTSDHPASQTLLHLSEGSAGGVEELLARLHVRSGGTVYVVQPHTPELPRWIQVDPVERADGMDHGRDAVDAEDSVER